MLWEKMRKKSVFPNHEGCYYFCNWDARGRSLVPPARCHGADWQGQPSNSLTAFQGLRIALFFVDEVSCRGLTVVFKCRLFLPVSTVRPWRNMTPLVGQRRTSSSICFQSLSGLTPQRAGQQHLISPLLLLGRASRRAVNQGSEWGGVLDPLFF